MVGRGEAEELIDATVAMHALPTRLNGVIVDDELHHPLKITDGEEAQAVLLKQRAAGGIDERPGMSWVTHVSPTDKPLGRGA